MAYYSEQLIGAHGVLMKACELEKWANGSVLDWVCIVIQ